MAKEVLIKRYNAYYQGWCQAFGEHESNLDEDRDRDRDVYWLTGEGRIGLAVSSKLIRSLNLALLRHHEEVPQLILQSDSIKVEDKIIYQLSDDYDQQGTNQLMNYLDCKDDLYMFMTNHFFYPSGTRIITFAKEKPTILLYKEMQPLKVLIN